MENIEIINLTGKDITIKQLKPYRKTIKIKANVFEKAWIDYEEIFIKNHPSGLPVVQVIGVTGFPEPREGVYYIVPFMVYIALKCREDLLTPNHLNTQFGVQRNVGGNIEGIASMMTL